MRATVCQALVIVVGAATLGACGGSDPGGPAPTLAIAATTGNGQTVAVATTTTLTATVTEPGGAPAGDETVSWTVVSGGGSITASSVSNAAGQASATFTAGQVAGTQKARASAGGASVTFTLTATPGAATQLKKSTGDGQTGWVGEPLPLAYAVVAQDQFNNPVAGVTVAWAVTSGGGSLSAPTSVTSVTGAATTVHTLGSDSPSQTATATVAGLTGSPVTFTATSTGGIRLASVVGVPANYGLHDTYVRDGLAFLCVWNAGVHIYDVGNGIAGGTTNAPKFVSAVATVGGRAHNAWWYHAPGGSTRYLFVGEEGPGSVGASSSGDIHVVDVSNLAAPVEVGSYHLPGAGTHNFWVDEVNQVLYAAYYNGGVVALDISGTLPSDLSTRELARIQPGGAGNTYVWGVMQDPGGDIYASDMLSGFWRLRYSAGAFSVIGGGNNVPERFTSDLWVQGGYGYTGGWGVRGAQEGNAVKIWQLGAAAPTLVDSVVVTGITTVSDVQVSADGKLLVFSAENGPNAGLHVYALAGTGTPSRPVLLRSYPVAQGLHTATVETMNGRTFVFAARNPSNPALMIFEITSLVP